MKHANTQTLDTLARLLEKLRTKTSLVEKRPGVFYLKSRAFLHFHDDSKGIFADVRLTDDFVRMRATTLREQSKLVRQIDEVLRSAESGAPPSRRDRTSSTKTPRKRPKSEPKTKPSQKKVSIFLDSATTGKRRKDCQEIAALMRSATGRRAKMWGPSIVGFGSYHYAYKSGREGDWMLTGFSPRKQNITIYIMPGFSTYGRLLEKLGAFKSTKSCLYIKDLDDVDRKVLQRLIERSVSDLRKKYNCK